MKTIASFLDNSSHHLTRLTKVATAQQHLSNLVATVIDPKFARFCRFAHYERNHLTLLVANAAWITKIRFQTPELIKMLREQPEFANLKNISCRIDDNYYHLSEDKPPPRQPRSKENETAWQAVKAQLKRLR